MDLATCWTCSKVLESMQDSWGCYHHLWTIQFVIMYIMSLLLDSLLTCHCASSHSWGKSVCLCAMSPRHLKIGNDVSLKRCPAAQPLPAQPLDAHPLSLNQLILLRLPGNPHRVLGAQLCPEAPCLLLSAGRSPPLPVNFIYTLWFVFYIVSFQNTAKLVKVLLTLLQDQQVGRQQLNFMWSAICF